MNNPESAEAGEQELRSAMFASLVLQQTNMATIFLGLAPHPQTGKTARDLDHAKYFIDQLEMLEAKTRGNLDKHEEGLLKHSLTSLRLAFVEEAGKAPGSPAAEPGQETDGSQPAGPPPQPKPAGAGPEPSGPEAAAADESRKKFSKKY